MLHKISSFLNTVVKFCRDCEEEACPEGEESTICADENIPEEPFPEDLKDVQKSSPPSSPASVESESTKQNTWSMKRSV